MTDLTDKDFKDAASGKLGGKAQETARRLIELMDSFREELTSVQRFGEEPDPGTAIAWEKEYRVGDVPRAVVRSRFHQGINDAFDGDTNTDDNVPAIYSPAGPTQQTYLYVAVCIAPDLWYLTGRRTNPVSWETLIKLIGEAPARISRVEDWQAV